MEQTVARLGLVLGLALMSMVLGGCLARQPSGTELLARDFEQAFVGTRGEPGKDADAVELAEVSGRDQPYWRDGPQEGWVAIGTAEGKQYTNEALREAGRRVGAERVVFTAMHKENKTWGTIYEPVRSESVTRTPVRQPSGWTKMVESTTTTTTMVPREGWRVSWDSKVWVRFERRAEPAGTVGP
jgi:hypothetical protein